MNNDTAYDQAQAQMASIREMVAALDCDYDRLEELRDEFQAFEGDEQKAAELGRAEWPSDVTSNPGEYAYAYDVGRELAELESEAGDCADREEAEQRIQEDALSVEVREDWHAAGDTGADPSEFRIVLCTGGPHVQIRGELSQVEPSRAWLEYCDWGQSMTERVNQPGDMDVLLSYARCFYFGE